jgi:hypothetical protein
VWDKKSKLFGDKKRMMNAIAELSHVAAAREEFQILERDVAECMVEWLK